MLLSVGAVGRYAMSRSLGLGLGPILPSSALYTKYKSCYSTELLSLQF